MEPTTTSLTKFLGGRKYVFQKESFGDILSTLPKLFIENHKEASVTADLKLDPDLRRYVGLEDLGHIAFMTIRYDNEVVGYALFYIDEEIRHKGLITAIQDMMFITKKHRGIGYSFIKFCDDILKQMGVHIIWRNSTCFQDLGAMFDRLGYVFAQKSYIKRL